MSRRNWSVLLGWNSRFRQGRLVVHISGLLLISACTFTTGPSKHDALAQIEAAYLKANGCVDYSDLKFDRGFERDEDNYIVVVSYHIAFKIDVVSLTQKDYDSFICGSMDAAPLRGKYSQAKLGNLFEEVRQYRFMRTDDGWKVRGEISE